MFVLRLVGRVSESISLAKKIFFPALTMAARAKKKILAKRYADAISELCRDLEHAYVY